MNTGMAVVDRAAVGDVLADDGRLDDAPLEESAEREWVQAHRALSRLARQRARADAEEGRWLLRARRAAAHLHMGFGSFTEYVERCFGYQPRSTHDKLRVAEALEQLPVLAEALQMGTLSWSALREVTRVATAETEAAWLEVARGKLVRQLEPLVASARRGDLPSAARSPDARRHALHFDVAAETFATVREAILQLRRSSDASIDDDAALLAMARSVLGGPRDDGHASYQVSLYVCSECGRGSQAAAGASVPVTPSIVAMAACDARHIGPVDEAAQAASPGVANDNARDARQEPMPVDEPTPVDEPVPVDESVHIEPMPVDEPMPVEPTPVDEPMPVEPMPIEPVPSHESFAHVVPPAPTPLPAHTATRHGHRTRSRTTQSIPPALRRFVLHRDHHRCRVPGCQNAAYVDLHHLKPRADGGPNTAENIIVLCSVHHRAAHTGQLVIEGLTSQCLRFRHADGTPYGHPPDPRLLEIHAKVFSALRNLGFRESEARAVLDELRREPNDEPPNAEQLLRAALQRIEPSRRVRSSSARARA